MSPRTQSVVAWSLFVLILAGAVVNQFAQRHLRLPLHPVPGHGARWGGDRFAHRG